MFRRAGRQPPASFGRMRAPEHAIPAPPFPRELTWVNVAPLRMDKQRGRPVLVEFWDFCRVNSLRTMPYLEAWHERYADAGLRVIGVHTGGFLPARDTGNVVAAVRAARDRVPGRDRRAARDLGLLRQRGLAGALPLGRGAARSTRCTTARAPTTRPSARSRRCWASSASSSARCGPRTPRTCCSPRRPPTSPAPTPGPTRPAARGRCSRASGEVVADGRTFTVAAPGCYPLVEHPHHTAGVLELQVGAGVTCHATCFTPGVAAPGGRDRPAGG